MIYIAFKAPDTVVWKRWRSDCKRSAKLIEEAVTSGNEANVADIYKRKSIKDQVFLAKEGPFNGKCAYCECYLTDFQHGDIEHFRPKKAVTDEHDNVIFVSDGNGGTIPHKGYYWLAYDWQNLLPSCQICNQPSTKDEHSIGKRNRFPVEAQHAMEPSEMASEKPLLINPTHQNPNKHLSVDPETGLMTGLTRQGKMCIKIFGLNVRDGLVEGRLKAICQVKVNIDKILHNPDSAAKQLAMEELKAIKEGKCEFSAAACAVLNQIGPFLAPVLEEELGTPSR